MTDTNETPWASNTPMAPSRRDALLMAIAKARHWADELAHGRVGSVAMLAKREGKVEQHAGGVPLPRAFATITASATPSPSRPMGPYFCKPDEAPRDRTACLGM